MKNFIKWSLILIGIVSCGIWITKCATDKKEAAKAETIRIEQARSDSAQIVMLEQQAYYDQAIRDSINNLANIDGLPGNITKAQYLELLDIAAYATALKMEHTDIFLGQVILESGWLTSSVSKNLNNITGMSKVNNRPTTQRMDTISIGQPASYKTVKHSIFDYYIWQTEYARGLSRPGYLQRLDKVYSPIATNYSNKVDSLSAYGRVILSNLK